MRDHKTNTRLALATTTMQSGEWEQAKNICLQLLAINPELVDANYLLGVIYQNTKQVERAIPCYKAVIQLANGHPDALNNLGAIFELQGKHPDALDCYQQAARHNPGHLIANYNFGRMLRISGQPGKAAPYLATALALSPDSTQVLLELALALKAQDKPDEALNCLQRARNCSPSDPAIPNITGNIFQAQGRIEQAINAYKTAIKLNPDFASAFNNLGSALVARGDISAALNHYLTAARLQPDWSGAASNTLLAENYISENPDDLFRKHRKYGALLENGVTKYRHTRDREHNQKIRIGYISPDFRFHSVAYFLKALFLNYDRSRFELVCFSDVASPDRMTYELRTLASDWHDTYGLSDAEVSQRVRNAGIDILVDLAGHTANNRLPLFAMQTAPVQVSYLGYPNTTGLTSIQYRITDLQADPVGKTDLQYTEKLVRLPECFLCYTPPEECPEIKGLPADRNGFVTYGSFNVLAKISDACLEAWSSILKHSPHSRLVLKSAGLQDRTTRDYILGRFRACGVMPDQVELIARTTDFRSHMELYNKIDISLDTFPYCGTTTTCESLWMGVPVISLSGACHANRVGVSLLHQANLNEWIADNASDYVSKARLLAENLENLRMLRKQLRTTVASSPICDGAGLTFAIENEYRKMLA